VRTLLKAFQFNQMRFIKGLPIILVVAFILAVFFFVSRVSAVYDPIGIYEFSLTPEELKNEISRVMEDDLSLTYKWTDSTGTDLDDLNYYVTFMFKRESIEATFRIKYLR
jgi:hypothetical protein